MVERYRNLDARLVRFSQNAIKLVKMSVWRLALNVGTKVSEFRGVQKRRGFWKSLTNFQVGFTIQVGGLYERHPLGLRRREQYQVGGEKVVVVHLQRRTLYLPPKRKQNRPFTLTTSPTAKFRHWIHCHRQSRRTSTSRMLISSSALCLFCSKVY